MNAPAPKKYPLRRRTKPKVAPPPPPPIAGDEIPFAPPAPKNRAELLALAETFAAQVRIALESFPCSESPLDLTTESELDEITDAIDVLVHAERVADGLAEGCVPFDEEARYRSAHLGYEHWLTRVAQRMVAALPVGYAPEECAGLKVMARMIQHRARALPPFVWPLPERAEQAAVPGNGHHPVTIRHAGGYHPDRPETHFDPSLEPIGAPAGIETDNPPDES